MYLWALPAGEEVWDLLLQVVTCMVVGGQISHGPRKNWEVWLFV